MFSFYGQTLQSIIHTHPHMGSPKGDPILKMIHLVWELALAYANIQHSDEVKPGTTVQAKKPFIIHKHIQ